MMKIYNYIVSLLCFALCAPVYADVHNQIDVFMEKYGIYNFSDRLINLNEKTECERNSGYFICYRRKLIHNNNSIPVEKFLKIESLKVHHTFCIELIRLISESNEHFSLKNLNVIEDILSKENFFAGIEYLTTNDKNQIVSIYIKNLSKAENQINNIISNPNFIKDYCLYILKQAEYLFIKKKFNDSLIKLQELHRLKFADFKSYYLTSLCFYKLNRNSESLVIAQAIARDYINVMSLSEIEQLADLLMQLHDEKTAENLYRIASKKMIEDSDPPSQFEMTK